MSSAGASVESRCREIALAAAESAKALRALGGARRRLLLLELASSVRDHGGAILSANRVDMTGAGGLSPALQDRLKLDESRLDAMARAIESIADQPDPVGRIEDGRVLPSGIRLEKRRVPLGVVLIIYESRPNVTTDAAALCLKSGNAAVLKGGSEAAHTNRAIVAALREPLAVAGIPGAVGFVDIADRAAIGCLVRLEGLIDLAIPRGGPGLMKAVIELARVPVIKHDAGNCHVYVDGHLDAMEVAAERIVVNAKVQRPGVCNAAEKLLVHRDQAERMVPRLCASLSRAGVEIRADAEARALWPGALPASEDDWGTEYLDLIMAVRVVSSLEEAANHIRRHGSGHTEAIVTSSLASAERFVSLVDSASVMVNCSTRFADGGEYGLGAEIGISTTKLHARGPMGAADLTTHQWVLTGSGQVR